MTPTDYKFIRDTSLQVASGADGWGQRDPLRDGKPKPRSLQNSTDLNTGQQMAPLRPWRQGGASPTSTGKWLF